MLVASMRSGPTVADKKRLWHFEKVARADLVFTCPGKFIKVMDDVGYDIEFDKDAWKKPVPDEVIEKLNRLQYFREAYDPYGFEPPQFNTHPDTVATAE